MIRRLLPLLTLAVLLGGCAPRRAAVSPQVGTIPAVSEPSIAHSMKVSTGGSGQPNGTLAGPILVVGTLTCTSTPCGSSSVAGNPGGTAGQLQVNNAGTSFAGITPSGAWTINPSTGVATLANSGVSAGSCGSATVSCSITVTAAGLITALTPNAISGGGSGAWSAVTAGTNANALLVSGTFGPTGGGTITANQLSAGTYSNALTLSSASNVLAGNGASITALAAGNISTGTLSASRLPSSGVTPGSCGSSSISCSITVDTYGRITALSPNTISGGGGGSSAGALHSIQESDGSGGFLSAGVPTDTQMYTIVQSSSAAPTFALPGLSTRTVSGATDTILTGDRGIVVAYTSGSSVAVTVPQANTAGFNANFVTSVWVQGAGTATFTPAAGTINGGASYAITQGNRCVLYSPDNTNWNSHCVPGQLIAGMGITLTPSAYGDTISSNGGVTSFSGDGTFITNSGSTGAVTTTLAFQPGPNQNVIYANNPAYGLYADGQEAYDCTITSGSPNVSCTTTTFSAADVGKQILATSSCCGTNSWITGSLVLGTTAGATTISSITDSHHIVASRNATGNTSPSNSILVWGHDDTTALQAIVTAAWPSIGICHTIIYPNGIMLTTTGLGNTQPGCLNNTTGSPRVGASVMGQGRSASQIGMLPNFDFTTCTGTTATNTCFFGVLGLLLHNVGISGFGNNSFSPAGTVHIIGLGTDDFANNIQVTGVGGSVANIIGVGNKSYIESSIIDGSGANGLELSNGSEVFNTFVGDDSAGNVIVDSGTLITMANGLNFANLGSSGNHENVVVNGPFECMQCSAYQVGTQLHSGQNIAFQVVSGATLWLTQTNLNPSWAAGNANNIGVTINGGTLVTSQSSLNGPLCAVKIQSTSTLVDQGGNNFYTQAAYPTCFTGTLNQTGISSFTTTQQTSGNITPSGGWGSTAALSAVSGTDQLETFTITTGGSGIAASPTVAIVFPNVLFRPPTSCSAIVTGTSDATLTALVMPTSSLLYTGVTLTLNATPVTAKTYTIQVSCGN